MRCTPPEQGGSQWNQVSLWLYQTGQISRDLTLRCIRFISFRNNFNKILGTPFNDRKGAYSGVIDEADY